MEQRRMSLRLIDNPVDRLARTIEALLVIAPTALSVEELATATEDEAERVETALGLLARRYREGRSGIVLEQVAGGYAFRAAREAAEACARLVERPVQRGLSQAALETLAIVAYLGPVSRPEIARIRGVAADSAVAGLVERGLITEAGRDKEGGAIRYETTPLFERVFGLTGLSELPRLDDLAEDEEGLRRRLEEVAGREGLGAAGLRRARSTARRRAREQGRGARAARRRARTSLVRSRLHRERPPERRLANSLTIASASSRVKARRVSVRTFRAASSRTIP